MKAPPEPRCALLLAAGGSTRLGRDKRLAHVGGRPLFAHVVAIARSVGLPVFAAASPGESNLPEAPGVAVLAEPPPPAGALRALSLWLELFNGDLVLLAADLPLLSAQFLDQLLRAADAAPAAWAVVSRTRGGLEPLCALYRPALLPALFAAIERGEQSLARTLAALAEGQIVVVDAVPEQLLLNVNDAPGLTRARGCKASA